MQNIVIDARVAKPPEAKRTTFAGRVNPVTSISDKVREPESNAVTWMQTLDAFIGRVTSGYYFDLHEFSNNGISEDSKLVLRNHIDMLEDLYGHI